MRHGIAAALVCVLTLFLGACGKPDIEASCTLNGLGSGECEFLNKGNGKGTTEIRVVVVNSRTGSDMLSEVLNSGIVEAGDVRSRKLFVSGMQDFCKADFLKGESWMDVCSFHVLNAADVNPDDFGRPQ